MEKAEMKAREDEIERVVTFNHLAHYHLKLRRRLLRYARCRSSSNTEILISRLDTCR